MCWRILFILVLTLAVVTVNLNFKVHHKHIGKYLFCTSSWGIQMLFEMRHRAEVYMHNRHPFLIRKTLVTVEIFYSRGTEAFISFYLSLTVAFLTCFVLYLER